MEQRLEKIENEIKEIKENHLHELYESIEKLAIQVATISVDIKWVKWFVFAFGGAVIGRSILLFFGI